jgi:hypothetical protein
LTADEVHHLTLIKLLSFLKLVDHPFRVYPESAVAVNLDFMGHCVLETG